MDRHTYEHCGEIKGVLACNMIEIDYKKKRVGPSGPRIAG